MRLTMSHFSDITRRVLVRGAEEARRYQQVEYTTSAALLGILAHGKNPAVEALTELGVDIVRLTNDAQAELQRRTVFGSHGLNVPFSKNMKDALSAAMKVAETLEFEYVGSLHVLLGLIEVSEGSAGKVLRNHSITVEQIFEKVKGAERKPL